MAVQTLPTTRKGSRGLNGLMVFLWILAGLIFIGWLGLQVKPAPFPSYSSASGPIATVPLPKGLPAPVERFYRKLYGEQIPNITSAVITGQTTIRPVAFLPAFPARFRFTHQAGKNYRHYIEATWFGFSIMQVNESYIDGKDVQELPWAKVENDPRADQAGNLGLWSETIWFPALFLTDPRVSWLPIDNQTAMLQVPFEASFERYVVRFNPDTGLIDWLESMRYKGDTGKKVLWLNQTLEYRTINGQQVGAVGAATWIDDGKPWAVFTVDEIILNADVSQYVRAKGL